MTTTPVTIYGIKNCDTMKKARASLDWRCAISTALGTRCSRTPSPVPAAG